MSLDAAKKEALEKWVVIGLAVVFLGILASGPLKRMRMGAQTVPVTAPVAVAPFSVAVEPRGTTELQRAPSGPSNTEPQAAAPIYTVQQLRDPMKSLLPHPAVNMPAGSSAQAAPALPTPNTATQQPPAVKVQGLVWGGPTPKAIINNRIYGLNDFIEQSQIVAIERGGVTLLVDGRTVFYPGSQTTPAGGSDEHSQQMAWR